MSIGIVLEALCVGAVYAAAVGLFLLIVFAMSEEAWYYASRYLTKIESNENEEDDWFAE